MRRDRATRDAALVAALLPGVLGRQLSNGLVLFGEPWAGVLPLDRPAVKYRKPRQAKS